MNMKCAKSIIQNIISIFYCLLLFIRSSQTTHTANSVYANRYSIGAVQHENTVENIRASLSDNNDVANHHVNHNHRHSHHRHHDHQRPAQPLRDHPVPMGAGASSFLRHSSHDRHQQRYSSLTRNSNANAITKSSIIESKIRQSHDFKGRNKSIVKNMNNWPATSSRRNSERTAVNAIATSSPSTISPYSAQNDRSPIDVIGTNDRHRSGVIPANAPPTTEPTSPHIHHEHRTVQNKPSMTDIESEYRQAIASGIWRFDRKNVSGRNNGRAITTLTTADDTNQIDTDPWTEAENEDDDYDHAYVDDEAQNDEAQNDEIQNGNPTVTGSLTAEKWKKYGTREAVNTSRQQYLLEESLVREHSQRIATAASCKWPKPKLIPIPSDPSKTYTPHCTLLHRCGDDTGCCNTDASSCVPIRTQSVDLYFHVRTLGRIEPTYEVLSFINHTECDCVDRIYQRSQITATITKPNTTECICVRHYVQVAPPAQSFKNDENDNGDAQRSGASGENRCRCDCIKNNSDCEWLKNGTEGFGIEDRSCIRNGRCASPSCEYGQYDLRTGRCPKIEDKLATTRRPYHQ